MIEYFTSTDFLFLFAKMLIVFGGVMGALAYTTLLERRVMAFIQMRPGPNRVGPFGLLQPLADGLKFMLKEQVVPTNANRFLYYLAPIVSSSQSASTDHNEPVESWREPGCRKR